MSNPADGSGPGRGNLSPEEKAALERKLSDLGTRIDKAAAPRVSAASAEDEQARSRAMGMGFSIAAQLVAGVGVGGAIGYFLDRWLGTAPWLMVLFLGLGFAAGMMNVIRTAREMQKISEAQSKGAKSVPDDAEDDK